MTDIGETLAGLMKQSPQGGHVEVSSGRKVFPYFQCCVSGTEVGVDKICVPNAAVFPRQAFVGDNVTVTIDGYSPMGNDFTGADIWWGDGSHTAFGGGVTDSGEIHKEASHAYSSVGRYTIQAQVDDQEGFWGLETLQVEILAEDTYDDLPVLAATDGGIYKFDGDSWSLVLSVTNVLDIKVLPSTLSSGEKIVLAASYDSGFFISRDSGDSWRSFYKPASGRNAIGIGTYPNRDQGIALLLRLSSTSLRLLRSLNLGESWTSLDSLLLSIDETRVKTVWKTHSVLDISFNNRYIFVYSENGTDGKVSRLDLEESSVAVVYTTTRLGGMAIRCAPRNSVYISHDDDGSGNNLLLRSEDNGDSWGDITESEIDDNVMDLLVSPKDQRHLVAILNRIGNTVGVTSYDHGESWEEGTEETSLAPYAAVMLRKDPQYLLIGTDDGVYRGPGCGYSLTKISGLNATVKALAVIE